LNADDMHCLRMADFCHATHICYVTMNSDHPLVKEHIRAGGRAVVLEKAMNGDMITVYSKGLHCRSSGPTCPGDAGRKGALQRAERHVRLRHGVFLRP
jgi:hypothetical protein